MFKLEIPILDPKMRGLGRLLPMEGDMMMKPQKAHPCVEPRRLSHYASFYDVPFGLCMRLRNDKLKKIKRALEGYISRLCRDATVQPIETTTGIF
jgi:hypothetical protein